MQQHFKCHIRKLSDKQLYFCLIGVNGKEVLHSDIYKTKEGITRLVREWFPNVVIIDETLPLIKKGAPLIHGHTRTKKHSTEYMCWGTMKKRCVNPNTKRYSDYGGRGIKVCDRWLNSFQNFFDDMGRRPSPNHSLDRINNDGDYEPTNCAWRTRHEQGSNKRNNRWIEVNGERRTMAQWATLLNIRNSQIHQMIDLRGEEETIRYYTEKLKSNAL